MAFLKRRRKTSFEGGGLVLFMEVAEAMKAERVLKDSGYEARLVAPPPELRKGCDLAVEINLVEKPGIERLLEQKGVFYVGIEPVKTGTSGLLQVVKQVCFDDWVMVKAGNMKLTFEKKSGIIVNTSGGGCPDIPYLHTELVGKKLSQAPRPVDIGFTLCALMLERALEESIAIFRGDEEA